MEEKTKGALLATICFLIITIPIWSYIFVLSQPRTGQIEIWIPEDAIIDKVITRGDIHWSGSDILIETYQGLQLREQKVRMQFYAFGIQVHYEGKSEDDFWYHASVYYASSGLTKIQYESVRLEGDTLEYTAERNWFGVYIFCFLLAAVGAIVSYIVYAIHKLFKRYK